MLMIMAELRTMLYVVTLCLVVLASGSKCPCSTADLCNPIQSKGKEVFGYSLSSEPWPEYDWSAVTTVAWNTNKSLLCHAHHHGARVVMKAPDMNTTILTDEGAREIWIANALRYAQDNFLDGINFDYEVRTCLAIDISRM